MREKIICISWIPDRRAFNACKTANASVRGLACLINLQDEKVASDLFILKACSAVCEFDQEMQ